MEALAMMQVLDMKYQFEHHTYFHDTDTLLSFVLRQASISINTINVNIPYYMP